MRVQEKVAHPFDVSETRAAEIQCRLAGYLSASPPALPLDTVTGAYALFLGSTTEELRVAAAAVTVDLPSLDVREVQVIEPVPSPNPYRPGLLAFSVGPALVQVLEKLTIQPDVLLFLAQGTAHPRGLGLAAHMGMLFDTPSVGCADSLLVGEAGQCGLRCGDRVPVMLEEKTIATVLRVRAGVRPVFVSPGHRMDLETAVRIILDCCREYRTPEPLRCARALLRERRSLERWG